MSAILAVQLGATPDDDQRLHASLVPCVARGREYYHPMPEVLAVNELRAATNIPPVTANDLAAWPRGSTLHPMRSRGITITATALLAVTLTGCSGSDGSDQLATTSPAETRNTTTAVTTTAVAATTTVVYQVRGSATHADVTLATGTGSSQEADVPVGASGLGFWRESATLEPGDLAYLSAQNTGETGDITCIILIHGAEVARNTSTGAYTIATCQAPIPAENQP